MKTLSVVLKRCLAIFLALVMVLLSITTAAALVLAHNYSNMISMALGQSSVKITNAADIEYYTSDYASEAEMQSAAAALCRDIEREGMVLLKNTDSALPLAAGARVSLLSQNSVDLVYGGAGAGSVDASAAPDLKTVLEAAGFAVNPVLWDFYSTGAGSAYRKEVPNLLGAGNFAAHEPPRSLFTQEIADSLSDYSDAAIVVIGRSGSESVDLPVDYLSLTAEEEALIQLAGEQFETVVLLLNATNPMPLPVLDTEDVDACLWVGTLGQEGAWAIGEALSGGVNPGGRLVDTWAYDPASVPAAANLGDYTISNSAVDAGNKYMVYAENIYVGYRYYETRYEDALLGQGNAGQFSYDDQVQFPFGYGLSYTQFEWSDFRMSETADGFDISVNVQNAGSAAGKEVVQIYLQNPYTDYDRQYGIEKPAVELVGFAKTSLLEPGASQRVEVAVPRDAMKVYDADGAGTYIVEAGDYYFTAASNAHAAIENVLAAKGHDTTGDAAFAAAYAQEKTDVDAFCQTAAGIPIENQLADVDIRTYDSSFRYLSRRDWTGTWPQTYQDGSWTAPDALLAALAISVPEDMAAEAPLFGQSSDLKLLDLRGADPDDPRWEELLSQLTARETYDLIRHAGYGTAALPKLTVPGVIHKDGPAGISSTLAGGNLHCMAYPPAVVLASTWNQELAEARGRMVGEDSLFSGVAVWYAPAMNIHRTAWSGRNFEYYAEDPFLSGRFGAKECLGFGQKGGIVTIKHFALNDQETNRMGAAVFCHEQAARQVYLKPFEISVVDGSALGIMSSMNRVGGRWIGGHSGIMTNILRSEWGYKGFVITDQTSFPNFGYCDIREGLAAGNDLWLNTGWNMWNLKDNELTPAVQRQSRTALQRYLYAVVNSNAMNGIGEGTSTKNVWASWQWLQIPVVIVILLLDVGCVLAFRRLWGIKGKKTKPRP